MKIALKDIRIPKRLRDELGDIAGLAKSMAQHGQLCDVLLTTDNDLIDGYRRIEAAKELGWSEVGAKRINVGSFLGAAFDANEMRKAFTVEERVAIGHAIEKEIGERRGGSNPQIFAELKGQETRQIAAERAGFGNPETYRQAKKVMAEGAEELREAVNAEAISISDAAKIAGKPKRKQRAAVKRVLAGKAKTAAASVEDVPEQGVQDGEGMPVPKKLQPVFLGRDHFAEAEALLGKALRLAEQILDGPHGHYARADRREILNHIAEAKKLLHWHKPHAVCPKCEANKKDCAICKGAGFVVRAVYKQPGVGRDAK